MRAPKSKVHPTTENVRWTMIHWEGDGTYTPYCRQCDWWGKPREIHSDAVSGARSHLRSKRHATGRYSTPRSWQKDMDY